MTNEDKKHLSEELNLKLVLLQQRLAVMDELLMHSSRVVNKDTAKFYVEVMNQYGNFFVAILHSLKSSFYVELLSFLGVKLNKIDEVVADKWATASVYQLAAGHNSQEKYLRLLNKHKKDIRLIDEVRHHVAHAKHLDDLNNLNVPGYFRAVDLLNDVASFIMKIHDDVHGIPGWNSPHILNDDNEYAEHTEELLNAIASSKKSKTMRTQYLKARDESRKKR